MTLAMCVAEVGDRTAFSGAGKSSFHESRLGRGGSSLLRLTVVFFGGSASSGCPFEVPGLLLLLELDRRPGSAQLRHPCPDALFGGSTAESWLMVVFMVRREPWDGARLMVRLVVPGKTYSLMLSRMLRDRLRDRTAVEGRACGSCLPWGVRSAASVSAVAVSSPWRSLRRMEELLYTVSGSGVGLAEHAGNALSQFLFSLVVAFVEPVKVSALPAAVRPHGRCIARTPHCELRLLESAGLEGRLQVHRRARGQSDLGLRSLGVAVLGPAVSSPLQAAKVQLRVRVLHAMVGRLEVLQDVLTCQAQLPLGVGIEHAAADVGRVVGDAIFGRVLAVRL